MPVAVVVESVLGVAILFAPFLNLIQSTTKFSYTEI